jgi:hypothetical protein
VSRVPAVKEKGRKDCNFSEKGTNLQKNGVFVFFCILKSVEAIRYRYHVLVDCSIFSSSTISVHFSMLELYRSSL